MGATAMAHFTASLRAAADDETASLTSVRRSGTLPPCHRLHIITRCRPGSEQSTSTVCQGIEGFAASEGAQLQRVQALVSNIRPGFGASIVAYGAWGSGKSRTMGTLPSVPSSNLHAAGILPQTLDTLFQLLGEGGRAWVSCAEVLAEEFDDLLAPGRKQRKLRKLVPQWNHQSASGSGSLESRAAAQALGAMPPAADSGCGRSTACVGRRMPDDWGQAKADRTPSRDAVHQSNKLKVQALTKAVVSSPEEALEVIAAALKYRTTTSTSSRQLCHLGHAVVRIDWSTRAASGARAGAKGLGQEAAVLPPDSSRCCITLLDCSSSSAANCLPQRSALLAKRALLSLNKALSHVQRGEAAMALRECQLTRALMGSVHQVLLVACLGGTLDAPLSRAASSASGATLDARAFTSPAAVAAASDEATAELVRLLGQAQTPRQQQVTPLRQSRLLEEQQLLLLAQAQAEQHQSPALHACKSRSPRRMQFSSLPSTPITKKPARSPLGVHVPKSPQRDYDTPTRCPRQPLPLTASRLRQPMSPEPGAFTSTTVRPLATPQKSSEPRGVESPGAAGGLPGPQGLRRRTSPWEPLTTAKSDAARGLPASLSLNLSPEAETRRSRSAFTLPYLGGRGQAQRQRLEEQYKCLITDFQTFLLVKRPLRQRPAACEALDPALPKLPASALDLAASPFPPLARVSTLSADDEDLFTWHVPDPILSTPKPSPAPGGAHSTGRDSGMMPDPIPPNPTAPEAKTHLQPTALLAAAAVSSPRQLGECCYRPTAFRPALPGSRSLQQAGSMELHLAAARAGVVGPPRAPAAAGQPESPGIGSAEDAAATFPAAAAAAAAARPRLSLHSSASFLKGKIQALLASSRRCMAKIPIRSLSRLSRAARRDAGEAQPHPPCAPPADPQPEALCAEGGSQDDAAARKLEGSASEAGGSGPPAGAPPPPPALPAQQGSSPPGGSAATSAGGAPDSTAGSLNPPSVGDSGASVVQDSAAGSLKHTSTRAPAGGRVTINVGYSAVLDDDADVKLWTWASNSQLELSQEQEQEQEQGADSAPGAQLAGEHQPGGMHGSGVGRRGAAAVQPKARRGAGAGAGAGVSWLVDQTHARKLQLQRWAQEAKPWLMSRSCMRAGAHQGPLNDP